LVRDIRQVDLRRGWSHSANRVTWERTLSHVEIPEVFIKGDVKPDKLFSSETLADAVVSAASAGLPVEVDPAATRFGRNVLVAAVTEIRAAAVSEISVRKYLRRPETASIAFAADLEVT
jgi:hypothetical protein